MWVVIILFTQVVVAGEVNGNRFCKILGERVCINSYKCIYTIASRANFQAYIHL